MDKVLEFLRSRWGSISGVVLAVVSALFGQPVAEALNGVVTAVSAESLQAIFISLGALLAAIGSIERPFWKKVEPPAE